MARGNTDEKDSKFSIKEKTQKLLNRIKQAQMHEEVGNRRDCIKAATEYAPPAKPDPI